MSDNYAITIRIDSEKSNLLDLLSEEYKRSKNFLINEALENYLEEEGYHLEQIQESIAQADDGEVVSHNQAVDEMNELFPSLGGE